LGITFQDITAQIEAEKTLRSNQAELQLLTRRLFAAHEEERHNIAGHLNDDYAQRVIRMMVEMHVLEKRLKQDHEARDLVARLKTGLKVLFDDMRFMAHTLEPLNLTVAPLSRSIRDYIEEFRRQTDLKIRFRIDNAVDQLPHECGVHLYRMLQESLSNVVRHADATTLDISFSKVGTAIEMTIADNGKGFDLNSALQERKGMGLIGMQERVRQMAGRIAIESSSSKGTSIQISIATDASACSTD
jgi:signal transduction histidine kinase